MEIMAELQAQKQLALGFIGVGWIGRNRMKALVNGNVVSKAFIAEPLKENADEARKLTKQAVVLDDVKEIYLHPELDGIVIATPSALHAEQALKALESGKAVFCQKPLGRNAQEVKQLVEASRQNNQLLAVDLSYRYTKAFQAIYDTIASGAIGDVFSVSLTFHNAYGPDKDWFYDLEKAGGGCLMDLGVHLIDMALYCLGFPEIIKVDSNFFCNGSLLKAGEEKVEDFARVSMLSELGTAIDLDCSWHVSAGKDAIIEATFFGTEGGVSLKNVNGSFYDFIAEKYFGTKTEVLVQRPDDWGGRAGLVWAHSVIKGEGFNTQTAKEYLKTAEIIDWAYGR